LDAGAEFVQEPALSEPWLPDDGDEAPPTRARIVQGLIEASVLALASGVGAEPAALGRLEGGTSRPAPHPVHDERMRLAPEGEAPEGLRDEIRLDQCQGRRPQHDLV